ncbi:MAG: YbaB/EbfC family nucleoid-associated protein [Acholeplasmatales bacterium]|nr:YbaB/EbfC family nucleoid-associated protein [Acholeplasmatales bacterium]
MNQATMMRLRKMQKEMMDAQKKLEETVFTGTSGGIVTVSMTGAHEIKEVKIDHDAFESKDDIEMIEDAVKAAFADCMKKIEQASQEAMGGFANMGMGGLGGLF